MFCLALLLRRTISPTHHPPLPPQIHNLSTYKFVRIRILRLIVRTSCSGATGLWALYKPCVCQHLFLGGQYTEPFCAKVLSGGNLQTVIRNCGQMGDSWGVCQLLNSFRNMEMMTFSFFGEKNKQKGRFQFLNSTVS